MWLALFRRLQSIAQAGLTYSRDPFDRERFEEIQRIAAEVLAQQVDEPVDRVHAILKAEAGYATPKVDVRAAVFQDDAILLVREAADGRWALPGGWADIGESAAEMAVREAREETGYVVRVTKLLAVLDKAKHAHPQQLWYVYKLFFRCEIIGGAPRVSHETTEIGWFSRDALPPLSLPRNTKEQVIRLFEHKDHPDLPTDFD
jgi:ADP-ribose pyrophosphatase YjhB (NUDIX family)